MTARLLLAFAALWALFLAAPGLDLAVSASFYDGTGFPAGDDPAMRWLRLRAWDAVLLLLLLCALSWAGIARRGRRAASDWRPFAFGTLTLLLGPGLLVNGVLKAHWGRPRPRDVEAFGGDLVHTPPMQVAGECLRNCSFVSGEAAGSAAAALVVVVLLAGRAPLAAALALSAAALVGALRVAMGAHFLSDVLMAWVLMALVARVLWRALGMAHAAPPRPDYVLRDLGLAPRRRL